MDEKKLDIQIEVVQVSIYFDLIRRLLIKYRSISMIKVATISFIIKKREYFRRSLYSARNTNDLVLKFLSQANGLYDEFCDQLKYIFEAVDILVADAGITADALTVKMTDDQFDRVIDVNLKGVFNVVRYVGPYMEKQGWGSIVTVSSVVGEQGNIGQINYSASKGAVISMTKTWAKEFSRKGANVRVNAVAPGYIMTRMMNTVPKDLLVKFAGQTMLKRLGQPEEIANVIAFLASDKASYITGTVISANGGMKL